MTKPAVVALASALLLAACSSDDEVCGDGQDNDSNGVADCEDSACGTGASCGPNGLVCATDSTCTACSGNGGTVEASGEQTCGDGVDNDCDGAVDCADSDCQPQGSQGGRVCDGTGRTCSAPDAAGISTCGTTAGGGGGGGSAAIGYLRLDGAEHHVLGALGSGYREQSLIAFQVLASDGGPYAGLPVRFSHESQGGSFVGSIPSCTSAEPPLCTASGTTDAQGRVGVVLHSGTRFAALSVRAEATGAGVTRSIVAGPFTVVGAKANGARFSLDCRPYNVPALTVDDCLYSRYAGQAQDVTCTATVGDRHGNLLAVPTLVAFQAEAGLVSPARFTPEFDPTQGLAGLGQALGKLEVYGGPLPLDVEPFLWETSVDDLDYGCGPRKTNPRDGLVTVVAFVEGEEGFVDLDLDGSYDEGEPYVDLPEPFLDLDDDGVRDPGEWYHDTDEDGSYDALPNGRWDPDTVLWTQARVLYTGYPMYGQDENGRELFTRLYADAFAIPPAPTPAAPQFAVYAGPPPTTEFYGAFFTDRHLNPLSSFTTFDAEAFVGNVSPNLTRPSGTADSLGTTFRMLYCDGPLPGATCVDGPADQGCAEAAALADGRCYLQTEVGREFTYGNYATLAVTCAEAGEDVVEVRTTVEGVTSSMWISGQCLP